MSRSADRLLRRLAAHGIRYLYGTPAVGLLPLIDAMIDGPLHFVAAHSLRAAGFMALGEARAARRPAVVLAEAGSAAADLAGPLWAAQKAGWPLVVRMAGGAAPGLFDLTKAVLEEEAVDAALRRSAEPPPGAVVLQARASDPRWNDGDTGAHNRALRHRHPETECSAPYSASTPDRRVAHLMPEGGSAASRGAGSPLSPMAPPGALRPILTALAADPPLREADRPSRDPRGEASRAAAELDSLAERLRGAPSFPPNPIHLLDLLRTQLGPDDILVHDRGVMRLWIGRYLDEGGMKDVIAPPAGSGAGWAIPGGLGVRLQSTAGRVIVLCGDAAFLMHHAELETARRLGAHLIVIVVRNQSWGEVEARQQRTYGRTGFTRFRAPNFIKLSRPLGCQAQRLERGDDLAALLRYASSVRDPVVIDCPVDTSATAELLELGGDPCPAP
ncbi:MAG: hypothetical protein GF355_14560 [Candidatus Eisenbacteria bacterium]|nr:hypothetical protein [Candidatus Eisenbacteria bacterium]